jgi:membrane protease YdiL (CAAX protease family)
MLSPKPWKLNGIILLLSGMFICLSFFSSLGALAHHFGGEEKLEGNSLLSLVFLTLSLDGSILVVSGVLLKWHRVSWREAFGFSTSGAGRALLWGVLTAIIFIPVGFILQSLSFKILPWLHVEVSGQETAVETLQNAVTWGTRAYLVLFAVVIAPVAEETLFRGILYPALRQNGFPRLALWGTSAAFAAVHLTPTVFLPLLVFGLALALLYEKTDNLLAPIAAHGFFNAVNVAIFYLDKYG